MTTQPIDREAIFHAAAEISDPQQRSAFLREKCEGDAKLIAEIEELLRHDGVLGSFLSDPVMRIDAEATQQYESIVEKPGQTIGSYKLREKIGEGGFGLVFVAEQTEPVRRKVALKIIKPGMDTKDVLARFNAEQQALALMDHPHIARVFDAGVTESGRPYFVMELVKGVPIVEYCNQQKLSIDDRLKLFVTVCQAVQHAHTKGIIHRDLKPSNIMIAPHDGVPVVKVIDFGVAKAIGQQLTNQTIYTIYAQMIDTPLYMSPEQAENRLSASRSSTSLGSRNLFPAIMRRSPLPSFFRLLWRPDYFAIHQSVLKANWPPLPPYLATKMATGAKHTDQRTQRI